MELNINQKHSGTGDNIVGKKMLQIEKKKNWFSMDNPVIWFVATLILGIVSFIILK